MFPAACGCKTFATDLALTIAQHVRIGIRGTSPGDTEERELGWFGWSIPRDFSRDGKKVLFEEEGEGGGPNYTVFLRDTDGSPPVRIGEGRAEAISPDNKWVITQPIEQGALRVVPTGAGEARHLTHDNIRYTNIRYLPDGKHLLAVGIEAGHGGRDYLIDVGNGEFQARHARRHHRRSSLARRTQYLGDRF